MKAPHLLFYTCILNECDWAMIDDRYHDAAICPKCKWGLQNVELSKVDFRIYEPLIANGEIDKNRELFRKHKKERRKSMNNNPVENATEAMKHIKEGYEKVEPKYLTIELDTLDSVPTVYYKGEKIEHKNKVSFIWNTNKGMFNPNSFYFALKYALEGGRKTEEIKVSSGSDGKISFNQDGVMFHSY